MAVGHFRPYLYERKFKLRTDHASLTWLYQRSEPSHQVARWLETLAEFEFQMEHRPGRQHGNADGLSRQCAQCKQCIRIEERDGGPTRSEIISRGNMLEGRDSNCWKGEAGSILLGSHVSKLELQVAQSKEDTPVGKIYRYVLKGREPPKTAIENESWEFKILVQGLACMRIENAILQIRQEYNGRFTWKDICPEIFRSGVT